MVNRFSMLPMLAALAACVFCSSARAAEEAKTATEQPAITLPAPDLEGKVTVEQALKQRRSVRSYADEPLTLQQVSQLLWAAQGITEPTRGLRTAPSAMASYPLRVYLVAGNVKDLPAGVYQYMPQGHKLELVETGDQRANVGGQPQVRNAPALIVYVIDYTVLGKKSGDRAKKFAYLEVGHSAQNVLLQEVALGLVGVPIGGADEAKVRTIFKLTADQEPAYVITVGKKG